MRGLIIFILSVFLTACSGFERSVKEYAVTDATLYYDFKEGAYVVDSFRLGKVFVYPSRSVQTINADSESIFLKAYKGKILKNCTGVIWYLEGNFSARAKNFKCK